MEWSKLLSSKRLRELDGGSPSGVNDHRTPFQSDFDRLAFSAPVKRLQDKAQVFPLEPNDAVRTRLTHSIEVSCVARGMGQRIGRWLSEIHGLSQEQARAIEDVCSAAGLVHDLGNPPFGHYGEDAIRAWFATAGKRTLEPIANEPRLSGDFTLYEGNARTFRLLCHLQILSDQYGLNLTAATLAAGMKYVVPAYQAAKNNPQYARRKPGFCYSETRYVKHLRAETGIGEFRHPLAYLIEAADDCVYSICDIEDAVKKGLLSFEGVCNNLRTAVGEDEAGRGCLEDLLAKAEAVAAETSKPKPVLSGRARDEAQMQMLRVAAIRRIVEAVCAAFTENYDALMSGAYKGDLIGDKQSSAVAGVVDAAKTVGRTRVYNTRQNIELELRGGHIIHGLLGALWVGLDPEQRGSPAAKRYAALISEGYRNVSEFEREEALQNMPRGVTKNQIERYYDLMLLTDYVGGMTDTFAGSLYKSITHG